MDTLIISDKKFKVVLSADDMKIYNIPIGSLSCKNIDSRAVLKRIIEDAKEKAGLDFPLNTLYIEAFEDISGGCELFVSIGDCSLVPVKLKGNPGGIFSEKKQLDAALSALSGNTNLSRIKAVKDRYSGCYLLFTELTSGGSVKPISDMLRALLKSLGAAVTFSDGSKIKLGNEREEIIFDSDISPVCIGTQ